MGVSEGDQRESVIRFFNFYIKSQKDPPISVEPFLLLILLYKTILQLHNPISPDLILYVNLSHPYYFRALFF